LNSAGIGTVAFPPVLPVECRPPIGGFAAGFEQTALPPFASPLTDMPRVEKP